MHILAMLVLLPAGIFLSGVVLSDLWEWFVHPLGLPIIGIAHAIGLSLLRPLTVMRDTKAILAGKYPTISEEWRWSAYVIDDSVVMLLVWLAGYIVKGFM